MADKDKPASDSPLEKHAHAQWSDNLNFSSDALHKSKQRHTQNLTSQQQPTRPLVSQSQALPEIPDVKPPARARKEELDGYVSEMNNEIEKVSHLIGHSVEGVSQKMQNAVMGSMDYIADRAGRLAGGVTDTFKGVTVVLLRYVAREMTVALKTVAVVLGRVMNRSSPTVSWPEAAPAPPVAPPSPVPSPPAASRQWAISLHELAIKGVAFRTIQDIPLIDDPSLKRYAMGDTQGEQEMMERALREIRNCAAYARKLPSPVRGVFAGKPMSEALEKATRDDLEKFLVFVTHRSKPFQEKSLKLAEAYATWIHKGAPER